jgi:hypothetical protein
VELHDLKQSVSELGDDDLRSLLATIRQSRRTSKRPPAAEKRTSSSTAKSTVSTDTIIAGMSTDAIATFLAMMEKGGSKV